MIWVSKLFFVLRYAIKPTLSIIGISTCFKTIGIRIVRKLRQLKSQLIILNYQRELGQSDRLIVLEESNQSK